MARRKTRNYFEPQRHPDHPRPVTRRQLIAQGFMTGAATVMSGGVLSLFANPRAAYATLSGDLNICCNREYAQNTEEVISHKYLSALACSICRQRVCT